MRKMGEVIVICPVLSKKSLGFSKSTLVFPEIVSKKD
jgi:hypothetical protein